MVSLWRQWAQLMVQYTRQKRISQLCSWMWYWDWHSIMFIMLIFTKDPFMRTHSGDILRLCLDLINTPEPAVEFHAFIYVPFQAVSLWHSTPFNILHTQIRIPNTRTIENMNFSFFFIRYSVKSSPSEERWRGKYLIYFQYIRYENCKQKDTTTHILYSYIILNSCTWYTFDYIFGIRAKIKFIPLPFCSLSEFRMVCERRTYRPFASIAPYYIKMVVKMFNT